MVYIHVAYFITSMPLNRLMHIFCLFHMYIYRPQWKSPLDMHTTKSISLAPKGRKYTSDVFYYVPLLATLMQLLQNPEVRQEIENPHNQRGDNLAVFSDGSVFKTHPLFSVDPKAIPIIEYYDELEVSNPPGSYVKKHKLGCMFFSLANIRPCF